MARENVIPNGFAFSFQPDNGQALVLHGSLASFTDKIRIRLASHNYLKRDGGEQEPMGSDPGRFSFRFCLLDPDPGSFYRAIVQAVRDSPRGLLTHPLLGNIRCACEGVELSHDLGVSANAPDATISFIEDALDTALNADRDTSPNESSSDTFTAADALDLAMSLLDSAQDAQDFADELQKSIAKIASTDAVEAAAAASASSRVYATAAVAAWRSSTPDPSLATRLETVRSDVDTTRDAILAIQLAREADRYPVLAAAEQVYASALNLDTAIRSVSPPLITYVVPGLCHVAELAAALYGPDSAGYIEQILTRNRIPNPFAIRAGTLLEVVSPAV
jgi:prophage DNA circulation protein